MHYDQMRKWDHMPNPWGDGKGKNTFPQIFQKSLKEIISNLDFEEKSKFPQWRGVVGKRWEKAGKAEEKLKADLKSPKMGSLG